MQKNSIRDCFEYSIDFWVFKRNNSGKYVLCTIPRLWSPAAVYIPTLCITEDQLVPCEASTEACSFMCAVVSTIKENTRRKSCSRLATAQGKTHSQNAVGHTAELKIFWSTVEDKSSKLANILLFPQQISSLHNSSSTWYCIFFH